MRLPACLGYRMTFCQTLRVASNSRWRAVDSKPNLCSNRGKQSRLAGTPAVRSGPGDVWGSASPGPGFVTEGAIMDTATQVRPARARCRVAPSVLALLESAPHGLLAAGGEGQPG